MNDDSAARQLALVYLARARAAESAIARILRALNTEHCDTCKTAEHVIAALRGNAVKPGPVTAPVDPPTQPECSSLNALRRARPL